MCKILFDKRFFDGDAFLSLNAKLSKLALEPFDARGRLRGQVSPWKKRIEALYRSLAGQVL